MTSIEETGKNIDEATRLALEKLGVTEDEVDVEILEEGSKGLLGLGRTPARVRVTIRRVERPTRVESPTPDPNPRPPRQRTRQRAKSKPEAKPVEETKPSVEQTKKSEMEAPSKPPVQRVPKQPEAKQENKEAPQPVTLTPEAVQEAAETAREFLQRILDGIGEGGKVTVKSATESQIALDVREGDAAILIGRHGQTIDAIQYLVSVMTHRRAGARIRISIDVEGYRNRREEALTNQALLLASKVKESGQEAVLDSLTAGERRIIHTALAEDPDVYTYSEGVEPDRHIVISPKK